jgi:hypothetical protein
MDVGRTLVVVGLVIAGAGVLIWLLGGLGLGRLPGDIAWRRGNVRVYVPIVSCLLLSLVGTLVLNLFFRR